LEADLKTELLERARVPPRRHLRLILAGGTGTGHAPRGPYWRGGIWPTQFHSNHSVFATKFYINTIQRYLSQVQVALNTKTAHYIAYHDIYLGCVLLLFDGVQWRVGDGRGITAALRDCGGASFTIFVVGHHVAGNCVSGYAKVWHYMCAFAQLLNAIFLDERSHDNHGVLE
jgi:hypothetical protein